MRALLGVLLVLLITLTPLAQSSPADFVLGPQVGMGTAWFDTNEVQRARVHGAKCTGGWPTDPNEINTLILTHYYDLALTEYIAHKRTGDAEFQTLARNCADQWWQQPSWIKAGQQRDFGNGAGPAPRHAGLGGLILRAVDGRPEMWDWINEYTRFSFDLWLKSRIANPSLYYGLREGAFSLHYAVWLAKVLPDSFPLQAGGVATNGAQLRAQYLTDAEAVTTNYFQRLQQTDGSWRWDDPDYTDSDGGQLKGVMQPFMVGLLLTALIDLHILTTNPAIKTSIQTQLTKACRHLYSDGPFRVTAIPEQPAKKWRDFWYFYHGGTTVNPTKYENGGGNFTSLSVPEGASYAVANGRQAISTIFEAFGYVFLLTGDPYFKAAGEDMYDAAYNGTDGFKAWADGDAKSYNQHYRRGASWLAWIGGSVPSPTPTPSPTATPTPSPTPTPTPPTVPCSLTAPDSVVIPRKGSRVVSINLSGVQPPVTVTGTAGSGQVTVQPVTRVVTGTSAVMDFLLTVKQNSSSVTWGSPCGQRVTQVQVQ